MKLTETPLDTFDSMKGQGHLQIPHKYYDAIVAMKKDITLRLANTKVPLHLYIIQHGDHSPQILLHVQERT